MTALRLLRLLILVAMALTPLRMTGVAPAMARPATAAMHHCVDPPAPADHRPASQIDCMIACAALPATDLVLAAVALPAVLQRPSPIAFAPGIAPGADPPPPRIS
jgi:hypothetical protein